MFYSRRTRVFDARLVDASTQGAAFGAPCVSCVLAFRLVLHYSNISGTRGIRQWHSEFWLMRACQELAVSLPCAVRRGECSCRFQTPGQNLWWCLPRVHVHGMLTADTYK